MLLKRAMSVASLAALLLPAVVGCFIASSAQAQTMECCDQKACARGHQKQTCLSTTAPTGSSQAGPERRASVDTPLVGMGTVLPVTPENGASPAFPQAERAPQHSPPDLYTIHLALLI